MMSKKIAAIVLSAFGFWFSASADPVSDSVDVSLRMAIEIALSEHPSIQIADKEIEKKQYYRKEQIAALIPNISAAANYGRTIQRQVMAMGIGGQTTRIEVGTSNNWSGGLNLGMPLVAPTLWKTVDLSAIDIELSLENARSSRISLVSEVKKAYFTLLMSKDSYDVLNASYHNAMLNAKTVTDRFNQGLVSEFDKLRADVQVQNQRPAVVAAENAVYLATMHLKVLMGMDVNEPLRFTGNMNDYEQTMTASLDEIVSSDGFEFSSTLRQLDIQAMQLEKTGELIRSTNLPTLALSGNYQWNSMNNDFKIGHYQWTPYSAVGITLNIPIFEGRAKVLRNKQNELTISNIRLQREDLLRNLKLSVEDFMNRINSAIEEVGANKENIRQAEKAYSISLRRYEVGSATLLELNDSELALRQSRLLYNQSIFNYLTARTDLEYTVGREVERSAVNNGFN